MEAKSFARWMRASTCPFSFSGCSISRQALIPDTVISFRPADRDIAANDRAKGAALHGGAHIDVNDEQANCEQGANRMDDHREVTQVAKIPRSQMGKPQNQAR